LRPNIFVADLDFGMAGKNLPNCISDSFGIPHDVKFLFSNKDSDESKEVFAHKFVLSLGSEVFKREFYGSMKESGAGIKIVDATHEVFSVMVEFIYDKDLDWNTYSLSFLSSLYYLAEKYDIKNLMEKILITIQAYKVIKENVMEVAVLGENNLFLPPLSDALYDSATIFLEKHFQNNLGKALAFFSETEATSINSRVLHELMSRINNSSICSNCKQSPCLDGLGVSLENFAPDAKVAAVRGRGHSDIEKTWIVDINTFRGCSNSGSTLLCTLDGKSYTYNCYEKLQG
jgi:hypothetical protein